MAWRTNGPTVESLNRRIEELERRIAALEGRRGGDWVTMADTAPRFRRDALAPAMPMQPVPFRPPQLQAPPRWDAATARVASMTTGAMLAMFSEGVVVVCMGFNVGMEWFVPLVVPVATLLFAAPVAWCLLTFTPWTILSVIEKKTGLDINGDGRVGDAQDVDKVPKSPVVVEFPGGAMHIDKLPNPNGDGLYRFARAWAAGTATFSERDAKHYGGYSRRTWRAQQAGDEPGLVDIFMTHNPPWAFDRGGKQGVELTGTGQRIMRKYAMEPPLDDTDIGE